MTTSTFAQWLRAQPALAGTAPPFDTAALPDRPDELFESWIRAAADAGVAEPHAATLATVDGDGRPDARTLILKDVGPAGWAVAGPRSSAKGAQLGVNPVAALTFWWQPVVRAVRVRGAVREASSEESAADFAARSSSAKQTVEPGAWVKWWIEPDRVEFWQGSPDRRHIRVVYELGDGSWRRSLREGS